MEVGRHFLWLKFCMNFHLSCACYFAYPSTSHFLTVTIKFCQKLQITYEVLYYTLFSSFFNFIPVTFEYSSSSNIPKLYVLPLERETKFHKQQKTNSTVCVRERTIATERSPLVGEVSANFGSSVARNSDH
jgi:hypothetical protein